MWIFQRNKKFKSIINGNIYIGKRADKRALFSGGVTQSGGELVEMWNSVSKRVKKERPGAKSCLVLGVGGGTCITSINKFYPTASIVGVELDKVMIEIYNQHFKKPKINLKLINDDAINYLKINNKRFDIIMVDIYIGRLNPKNTRKKEFIICLLEHLKRKGIVIYSCHFDKNNLNEFDKFKRLTEIYFNSEVIYEFPLNKVLLLTQR